LETSHYESLFRRDAETSTRDAGATQSSENRRVLLN
jgi:hypothetical protein